VNKIQGYKFGIIFGLILFITFLVLTIWGETDLFYLSESYLFIIFNIAALYIVVSSIIKFLRAKKKPSISFEEALELDDFKNWIYNQVIERNYTRTQLEKKMKNSFLSKREIEKIWANVNMRISFCNPEFKEKAKQKGIEGVLIIIFGFIILIYDTDLFISSFITIFIGFVSCVTAYLESSRLSGD